MTHDQEVPISLETQDSGTKQYSFRMIEKHFFPIYVYHCLNELNHTLTVDE